MGFNLSGGLSYTPVKLWERYDAVENRYKQMVSWLNLGIKDPSTASAVEVLFTRSRSFV